MRAFRTFELEAIHLLAKDHLSAEQFETISQMQHLARYEFTGSGYFATVAHPTLPSDRAVLDDPFVAGRLGESMCGFIVFLGENELVLECHSFGDVIADFRDQPVAVSIEPSNRIDLR